MKIWLLVLAACGGGGGGGPGGGGPDAQKPTKTGYVFLQSYDAMNLPGTPTRGGSASAGFYGTAGTCTGDQTVGACTVSTCTSTMQPTAVSAGVVTLSGAAQPIMLTPGTDKTYTAFMSMSPLFAGGESVVVSAAGADVPAFSKSITMPGKATITSPSKPAAGTFLAVSRSADFSVTWTGGGSGSLQIFVSGTSGRVTCRFPAGSDSAAVPAAALAMLPAGNGSFAMAAIADGEQDAGDYAVDVSAYFNAVWPDDSIVSGGATLQ